MHGQDDAVDVLDDVCSLCRRRDSFDVGIDKLKRRRHRRGCGCRLQLAHCARRHLHARRALQSRLTPNARVRKRNSKNRQTTYEHRWQIDVRAQVKRREQLVGREALLELVVEIELERADDKVRPVRRRRGASAKDSIQLFQRLIKIDQLRQRKIEIIVPHDDVVELTVVRQTKRAEKKDKKMRFSERALKTSTYLSPATSDAFLDDAGAHFGKQCATQQHARRVVGRLGHKPPHKATMTCKTC